VDKYVLILPKLLMSEIIFVKPCNLRDVRMAKGGVFSCPGQCVVPRHVTL
jgi:hypothetical protein